jgi:hypothetical protein
MRSRWQDVQSSVMGSFFDGLLSSRLRNTDVKAEHFERQVSRLQEERDELERKLDEAVMKLKASQNELDALVSDMDALVSFEEKWQTVLER